MSFSASHSCIAFVSCLWQFMYFLIFFFFQALLVLICYSVRYELIFYIKDPFCHCMSVRNQAIRGRLDLLCSAQTLQWHEGIPQILRNVVLTQAENETAQDLSALLCGVLTIKITLGKTTFKAALKSGWLSVCTGRRHFSIRFCKNQNFFWKIIVWFLSLFIYLTSDREIDAQWG